MTSFTRRTMLSAIPGLTGAVAITGTGMSAAEALEAQHPDRALLHLWEAFETERQAYDMTSALHFDDDSAESDAICNQAYDRVAHVLTQIECAHVSTIDGLLVKAKALRWCFGTDPIQFDEGETTDVRLAAQIINRLLQA